jgi:membrane fusion protein, multidrug efflux system
MRILLNDLGQTVVRVLLEGNLVGSVKVSSLGEASDGLWVSGLPSEVSVITVGQNYIIDGESVDPSFIVDEANS